MRVVAVGVLLVTRRGDGGVAGGGLLVPQRGEQRHGLVDGELVRVVAQADQLGIPLGDLHVLLGLTVLEIAVLLAPAAPGAAVVLDDLLGLLQRFAGRAGEAEGGPEGVLELRVLTRSAWPDPGGSPPGWEGRGRSWRVHSASSWSSLRSPLAGELLHGFESVLRSAPIVIERPT